MGRRLNVYSFIPREQLTEELASLLLLIKRVCRLLRILECKVVSCLCAHQAYEYPVGSSVWFCSSWKDFGRNKGSGLEVRCTGRRIHHCHHTEEEGFHIHPVGKSPIAGFTWKHPEFLCSSCIVCGGYLT